MTELHSPNLMRVAGLILIALGVVLLAKAVTSFAHVARNDAERAELTANQRTVGMWFCVPMLFAGLLLQVVSEFVTRVSPGTLAVLCLVACFWLLVSLMLADWIAERMLDARRVTEARRKLRRSSVVNGTTERGDRAAVPLRAQVA